MMIGADKQVSRVTLSVLSRGLMAAVRSKSATPPAVYARVMTDVDA